MPKIQVEPAQAIIGQKRQKRIFGQFLPVIKNVELSRLNPNFEKKPS